MPFLKDDESEYDLGRAYRQPQEELQQKPMLHKRVGKAASGLFWDMFYSGKGFVVFYCVVGVPATWAFRRLQFYGTQMMVLNSLVFLACVIFWGKGWLARRK